MVYLLYIMAVSSVISSGPYYALDIRAVIETNTTS